MSRSARRMVSAAVSAALIACLIVPLSPPALAAGAVGPSGSAVVAPADPKLPLTAADLASFVDSVIKDSMAKYHAPGAVVAAVQDGSVILAKGYGYANLEADLPVDPETTAFRIGSVTKTFTGTAAMQLVEAGKLDLQQDVNSYLQGWQVPAAFGKPVTMFNLLTHTAGFDERYVGMEVADYTQVQPLGQFLSSELPARVRAPGEVTQYSNHGLALAGHVVESIAGTTYEQYITKNIFEPLGMTNSRPRVTADVLDRLAREYSWKGGKYLPMRLYDYNVYPSGSVCATASDMAKYMIAHLGDGSYGEGRILAPETLADMHARHFAASDALEGMAYTFYERYHGGHRFIAHGGDTNGTHSFMLLYPEGRFGLFVSTNGERAVKLVADLIEGFYDRFYPNAATPPASAEADPAAASALTGIYRTNRYPRDTFGRVLMLIQPQTTVRATADGSLSVVHNGTPGRYVPLGGLSFLNVTDGTQISFLRDAQGDVAYLLDNGPVQAFERLRWYEGQRLHMALIAIAALTFLATLAGGLARRRRARHRNVFAHQNDSRRSSHDRPGWALAALVAVVNLLAIGAFVGGLLAVPIIADVVFVTPTVTKIALLLFAAGSALAAVLAAYSVYALVRRRGSGWSRIGLIAVSLVALAFAWVMNYYNMVGMKF